MFFTSKCVFLPKVAALFESLLLPLQYYSFHGKLPTLRVTLFYYHPSITLFMEELPTLRVKCVFSPKVAAFLTRTYYHFSITLFMEKLPTLRVTTNTPSKLST